jgi:hypothetical protein
MILHSQTKCQNTSIQRRNGPILKEATPLSMTSGETVTLVHTIIFHINYTTTKLSLTHRSGRGDGVGIGCCVPALPSLHEQVVRAGIPSSELMLEPLSSFSMLTPRDWLTLLTDETSFISIDPLQTQNNYFWLHRLH